MHTSITCNSGTFGIMPISYFLRPLVVLSFWIMPFISVAQVITLNPTDPLPPCTSFMLGETITFERGANCNADVVLLDRNNVEVFRTSDASFTYTFDTAGEFTFFCGAGSGAVAMAAICVQVGVIPTLSEWSIICLTLIMMIAGCLAFQQRSDRMVKEFQ